MYRKVKQAHLGLMLPLSHSEVTFTWASNLNLRGSSSPITPGK